MVADCRLVQSGRGKSIRMAIAKRNRNVAARDRQQRRFLAATINDWRPGLAGSFGRRRRAAPMALKSFRTELARGGKLKMNGTSHEANTCHFARTGLSGKGDRVSGIE